MTADIIDVAPSRAAWVRCHSESLLTVETRRAALVYAATRTAEDPAWLTPTREILVRDIVGVALSRDRFWPAFDKLVGATIVGFGPLMLSAVDALVAGDRS